MGLISGKKLILSLCAQIFIFATMSLFLFIKAAVQ
jgi:hypothetical protein